MAENKILNEINTTLLTEKRFEYLKATQKNIDTIRRSLLNGSREWCQEAIPALYIEGAKSTGLPGGFGVQHQQAMQVLADNFYQRMQDVDSIVGRRIDDIYRELTLQNITYNISGIDSWQVTKKNLEKDLLKNGITGFVDKSGRRWSLSSYADMATRAVSREVKIEGHKNRLLENGYDVVEITGGVSKVTCQACKNWVGRRISLTGKTEGLPTLADARASGVFHPRCTHSITKAGTFEERIAEYESK